MTLNGAAPLTELPVLNRALIQARRTHGAHAHMGTLRELPERAVQFGTGAFLRGFVEAFVDEANARGQFNGRIAAVASTATDRNRVLTEQDGLYTLIVAGSVDGSAMESARVISSLSRSLSAVQQWADVLQLARDPNISVIFSNTTESGLALDSRDTSSPVPVGAAPHSFPAKLARFLIERGETSGSNPQRGVTVLPCELVENNGDVLRALVLQQAALWKVDAGIVQWMQQSVTFCNTLVDRIVPGVPDPAVHQKWGQQVGYADALLTIAEPYALFAIEGTADLADKLGFVRGNSSIEVVRSVRPHRERKLRLLNGAHTAITPLALLAGCETVGEVMREEGMATWLRELLHADIVPVLDVPGGAAFANATLDRFRNPHVQHRLRDIAVQGTLKFRVRLLPLFGRYSARGDAIPDRLLLAFAALLLLHHPKESQRRSSGNDALSDTLAATITPHWLKHNNAISQAAVRDIARDETLWGICLDDEHGFVERVTWWLRELVHGGALAAMRNSALSADAENRSGAGASVLPEPSPAAQLKQLSAS